MLLQIWSMKTIRWAVRHRGTHTRAKKAELHIDQCYKLKCSLSENLELSYLRFLMFTFFRDIQANPFPGRAMAQAVNRRPLTAAVRVRAWVNPMEFAVDKVALGQVFLRVLRFSSVSIIPPWAPLFRKLKSCSFIHPPSLILIRGWTKGQ
jgi:hypothetical protein